MSAWMVESIQIVERVERKLETIVVTPTTMLTAMASAAIAIGVVWSCRPRPFMP